MSTYNTKNYTEQGGDVTHIGGKLIIEEGATVEGLNAIAAKGAAVSDATDDAVATVNALLASLRTAGIIAAE